MSQARPHVLVIDDEVGIREMLSYELGQEGFDVTCASSGMAAIEMLKSRRFDVAVSDFKMPGMTGAETVAALKAIDPDLEVIVATGYATTENALECMKSGAYDLIEKPYDVEDLKRLLEAAMVKTHLDAVAALYEATGALLGGAEGADLAQRAADAAQKAVQCTAAGLLLAKGGGGFTSVVAAGGQPLSEAFVTEALKPALAAKEPLRRPAPGAPDLVKGDSGEEFVCVVMCPLRASDSAFGVLGLFRDASLPVFTTQELQAAGVFAATVALVLENARLKSRGN